MVTREVSEGPRVLRFSEGEKVRDDFLGDCVIVAVRPKHEPHWDYIVQRGDDSTPYEESFVASDSMLTRRCPECGGCDMCASDPTQADYLPIHLDPDYLWGERGRE